MLLQFPKTFEPGLNVLLKAARHPEINMDFAALVIGTGETYEAPAEKESVAVLCSGEVTVTLCGRTETLTRSDVFYGEPVVIHVPDGTTFALTGVAERSELLIVSTANARPFEPEIMRAADCLNPAEIRGVGVMNDAAVRETRTYMDRQNRPETNLFIGEVVMAPGKWSSFPPHSHRETEIYFYKFLPENGYGFAEVDRTVHRVKQHALTVMSHSEGHAQVTAPAYAEWYLWCIRLQDDAPLVSQFLPEHDWANSPDARLYPDLQPGESPVPSVR